MNSTNEVAHSCAVPVQPANGTAADRFSGLVGAWKQLANFGVIGVGMALLSYLVVTGRQDTAAIRSEASEAHKGMAVMTDVLREGRDGQKELTRAIKSLTSEVRHLRSDQAGKPQERGPEP